MSDKKSDAEVFEQVEEAVADAGQPTELWTPPERLEANVGKMAWHLFLKWWDHELRDTEGAFPLDIAERCGVAYSHCIEVAKRLEDINNGR